MSHVHVPKPQSLPQADGIALRAPKTSKKLWKQPRNYSWLATLTEGSLRVDQRKFNYLKADGNKWYIFFTTWRKQRLDEIFHSVKETWQLSSIYIFLGADP